MSAAGIGADKRAQSNIQLVNGFADVRESVEEVMQAIRNDVSDQISSRSAGCSFQPNVWNEKK
jgi:hypothetical protein